MQNYAWGGTEFIPQLIGQPVTSEKCAEYWMGAHEKAPAIVEPSGEKLNELIAAAPELMLGKAVFQQFGRLPFLFKVLDVRDMLSIQVHPSKSEAERGFARENKLGIPLSAAQRNYKDDNHKPEIMVALGDFWLLHGFKSPDKLAKTLKETPELAPLLPIYEKLAYKGLYQHVMEESIEQTNSVLNSLIKRVLPQYKAGKLDRADPDYWAAKAYLTFCKNGKLDKGIYSIYFFNIVNLKKGQGIFQDAGLPHAYLEGQNIELMANSDNVLRGGLTTKHVDVPELLKHVNFTETIPNVLPGELQTDGIEWAYNSPATDFAVSKIGLNNQCYEHVSTTIEIILVMEGKVKVQTQKMELILNKGEAFVVTVNVSYTIAGGRAVLFKAKVGI